jgi:hypothetical protein
MIEDVENVGFEAETSLRADVKVPMTFEVELLKIESS